MNIFFCKTYTFYDFFHVNQWFSSSFKNQNLTNLPNDLRKRFWFTRRNVSKKKLNPKRFNHALIVQLCSWLVGVSSTSLPVFMSVYLHTCDIWDPSKPPRTPNRHPTTWGFLFYTRFWTPTFLCCVQHERLKDSKTVQSQSRRFHSFIYIIFLQVVYHALMVMPRISVILTRM